MSHAFVLVALLVSFGLQELDLRDAVVWLPNTSATDSTRQATWARAVDTPVLIHRAPVAISREMKRAGAIRGGDLRR